MRAALDRLDVESAVAKNMLPFCDALKERRERIESHRLENVLAQRLVVVSARGVLRLGQDLRTAQELFHHLRQNHRWLRRAGDNETGQHAPNFGITQAGFGLCLLLWG